MITDCGSLESEKLEKHVFLPDGAKVERLPVVTSGLGSLFLLKGPCTLAVGELQWALDSMV